MSNRQEFRNGCVVEYRELTRLPGYRFGNDGSVWSRWARRNRHPRESPYVLGDTWRQLKTSLEKGYRRVQIGRPKNYAVHALILEAFVGPRPKGMECRHLDGNRSNNRLENLAWGTAKDNTLDAIRHESRRFLATLETKQLIRDELARGATPASLARQLNASHSCLRYLVKEIKNDAQST